MSAKIPVVSVFFSIKQKEIKFFSIKYKNMNRFVDFIRKVLTFGDINHNKMKNKNSAINQI